MSWRSAGAAGVDPTATTSGYSLQDIYLGIHLLLQASS